MKSRNKKWRYRILPAQVEHWKPQQLELGLEDFMSRNNLGIPFYQSVQYVFFVPPISLPNKLENERTA